jgi:hypothetical protein
MITTIETPYGNLYERTRDVVKDDVTVSVNEPTLLLEAAYKKGGVKEFTNVPTYVCMDILFTIVNDELKELWDKPLWFSNRGQGKYRGAFYQSFEHLTWKGCRSTAGKVRKYNREVQKCLNVCVHNEIEKGLEKLTKTFDKYINLNNKDVVKRATISCCDISNYSKEWLDQVDDENSVKHIEGLYADQKSINEKIKTWEEKVRLNRIEAIKTQIKDQNFPDQLVSSVVNGLDDPQSLKINTMFGRFG